MRHSDNLRYDFEGWVDFDWLCAKCPNSVHAPVLVRTHQPVVSRNMWDLMCRDCIGEEHPALGEAVDWLDAAFTVAEEAGIAPSAFAYRTMAAMESHAHRVRLWDRLVASLQRAPTTAEMNAYLTLHPSDHMASLLAAAQEEQAFWEQLQRSPDIVGQEAVSE
jgi:hypothetical protein